MNVNTSTLSRSKIDQSCKSFATGCKNLATDHQNTGKNTQNFDEKSPENGHTIFNKLAQSGDDCKSRGYTLKKRAKAKFITMGFIFDLINLKSPLKKSYWNTLHCVEHLLFDQEKKQITGKYCKNRWCLVCNRIRTGKLMNLYFDEFSKYEDLYFVTLTIRNIPKDQLPGALKNMQKQWGLIRLMFKSRKMNFDGIRKNECTYNLKENTFHPHFHVVIQGKDQSELLLSSWMNLNKDDTNRKGQDVRKCDQETLKELFKYFTKIVKRDKTTDKNEYPVLIEPLDLMNQAYYKMRVFNSFGKFRNLKIDEVENIDELQADDLDDIKEGNVWEWVQDQSDWVSEYGELLTNNEYHKKIKVVTK